MARRAAAVLLFPLTLGAIAAVLHFRDDSGGFAESLAAFSNRGRPIELAVPESHGPGEPKFTGDAVLIAERRGLRFYRLPRADGSSCWAAGELRGGIWQIVELVCEKGFQRFPDAKRPVVNVSRFEISIEAPHLHYTSLAGFAADGVTRIAVVDTNNGLVPVADVLNNVYYSKELPKDGVNGLAALDEDGKVVWRSVAAPDEEGEITFRTSSER
jgi:hypothetical protein